MAKSSDKDQSNYIEDNTASITENYYLIDFENVHEAGLSCSRELNRHDHIHIFSTENATKISLELLVVFNSSDLESHIIPAGKQSLDMHLTAYLGYLIGMHQSENCKYIVVSNDTDYDNIISFLNKTTDSEIIRQAKIEMPPKKAKASANNQTKVASASVKRNNEVQDILSKASFQNSIITDVASIVCQHYKDEKAKHTIYTLLVQKYGSAKGLDIYNHIKKCI